MRKSIPFSEGDLYKVDFHMHSVFSDGTDTLPELLKKIQNADIAAFSLTDHDAYEGCRQMQALCCHDQAPLFIPGIEFSTQDEYGKYHILGYNFDGKHSPVIQLADYCHKSRILKAQNRLAFLKEAFGFTFSDREIDSLLQQKNPGKPHIARLMMAHGYAESISDAINDYLSQYPGKEDKVTPKTAIEAILASNGIPVLAHGLFGNGSQRLSKEEMLSRAKRLVGLGLQGLECFYSGFSSEQAAFLCDICHKHQLLVTAGSDYHGSNKAVELGTLGLEEPLPDTAMPDIRKFVNTVLSR